MRRMRALCLMRDELARPCTSVFRRLEVLRGIDSGGPPGVVLIIGPSGSDLLRCINHLEKINAGRLWWTQLVGYREQGGRLHELREQEMPDSRDGLPASTVPRRVAAAWTT